MTKTISSIIKNVTVIALGIALSLFVFAPFVFGAHYAPGETGTNEDATSLTLVKEVINDNGGIAASSDWTLTATGPSGFSGPGPIVSNGTPFDAGTYDLSESGPSGYSASAWDCIGGNQTDGDTVEIGLGEEVTCTITNDDQPGSISGMKFNDLDGDGVKDAGEPGLPGWTILLFDGTNTISTTTDANGNYTFNNLNVVAPNLYGVCEQSQDGWQQTLPATTTSSSTLCTAFSTGDLGYLVDLQNGENVTDLDFGNFLLPQLTVTKIVINDNGGTATTSDFALFIDAATTTSGVATTSTVGGHVVSETNNPGYTATIGGDCDTDGNVTLAPGDNKTCTITNDDIPPSPPPPPKLPCGCIPLTQTLVSDQTNMIGGGTAVPVATSSAWTASIPGAIWIWQASSTVPNAVVPFEKSFTVVGTVLSAQLSIAADNSYKVFIDGVQVAADPSATNFTLATQDVHDLTLNVTPGTHTLRIEVTNNGVFGALNPAGLLYKFEIETCPHPPASAITVNICNSGAIINSTIARSSTGGNSTGGSVGGHGGRGGDIDPAGSFNNGGASSGNGGNGGNASNGGLVSTGNATAQAGTENDLNGSDVDVQVPADMNSSSLAVVIDNLNEDCKCGGNTIENDTRARARSGDNTVQGSTGGNGDDGGDVSGGTGNFNNGGATSGDGGDGGAGGLGGKVFTGNASSTAGTINVLNFTRIRVH